MKIGVYVGSFNPVHKGHIKIVRHLLKYFLDKVIVVATQNYWDKKNLINLNDRITILNEDALDSEVNDKFDLIFIDASKGNNINFFNK